MARKARSELEGGLYHVITRGNDRRDIFHSPDDRSKFLSLMARQKTRAGFYLYAYCLMTNHVHLLIERQAETLGSIMQRLLTGYSQYYNRRYKHVGHVFQGRHKAILCQSQTYLTRLVRYIHLNPVRARMVDSPEQYLNSSHRAYLSLEQPGIVDVDPVLRHFGSKREAAVKHYMEFMRTPADEDESLYSSAENDVLGSEEFVDANIHRLGATERRLVKPIKVPPIRFEPNRLLDAVEAVFKMPREHFCGQGKNARAIMAKEVLILIGREAGATIDELAAVTGLDCSSVSRRCDAARQNTGTDRKLLFAKNLVEQRFAENIAESKA